MPPNVKISDKKGFKFTRANLENPVGKNNLTAFAASFQKTLYREKIYPCDAGAEKPLDTLYENKLHGRVDLDNNVIILKPWSLTMVPGATSPVFAPGFMSIAFKQFRQHMARAYMADTVSKEGNPTLLVPTPKRGYVDPTSHFNHYHEQVVTDFLTQRQSPFESPIDTFQTFIPYYAKHLKTAATYGPVTKTSFILSSLQDPFCLGMSIAISNDDASNDEVKYDKFISDPNFNYYTKVAKRYGFLVDKNKPWVLSADLFSGAMLHYLKGHLEPITYQRVTANNFFDAYYHQTYLSDIQDLWGILTQAYARFSKSSPLYQKTKIAPGGDLSYTNHPRGRASAAAMKTMDPSFLIDLYTDLRQIESYPAYKPVHVRHIKAVAQRAYSFSGAPFGGPEGAYGRAAFVINFAYKKLIGCEACRARRVGPELTFAMFAQMFMSDQVNSQKVSKRKRVEKESREELEATLRGDPKTSPVNSQDLAENIVNSWKPPSPNAGQPNPQVVAAKRKEYSDKRLQKTSKDIMSGYRSQWRAPEQATTIAQHEKKAPGYQQWQEYEFLKQAGLLTPDIEDHSPPGFDPFMDMLYALYSVDTELAHRGGLMFASLVDDWPDHYRDVYSTAKAALLSSGHDMNRLDTIGTSSAGGAAAYGYGS